MIGAGGGDGGELRVEEEFRWSGGGRLRGGGGGGLEGGDGGADRVELSKEGVDCDRILVEGWVVGETGGGGEVVEREDVRCRHGQEED